MKTHWGSTADLPGDQRKDKSYKPPRKSPALSEDSVPEFRLDEDGFEVVEDEVEASEDGGGGKESDKGSGEDSEEEEGDQNSAIEEEETTLRKVSIPDLNFRSLSCRY